MQKIFCFTVWITLAQWPTDVNPEIVRQTLLSFLESSEDLPALGSSSLGTMFEDLEKIGFPMEFASETLLYCSTVKAPVFALMAFFSRPKTRAEIPPIRLVVWTIEGLTVQGHCESKLFETFLLRFVSKTARWQIVKCTWPKRENRFNDRWISSGVFIVRHSSHNFPSDDFSNCGKLQVERFNLFTERQFFTKEIVHSEDSSESEIQQLANYSLICAFTV